MGKGCVVLSDHDQFCNSLMCHWHLLSVSIFTCWVILFERVGGTNTLLLESTHQRQVSFGSDSLGRLASVINV